MRVTIPCHTYIRKFIQSHYPDQTIIPLERHHYLGSQIFALLEKGYTIKREEADYADSLEFEINEFFFCRYGADLPPYKVHLFNRIVDSLFKEGMYRAVDLAQACTPTYRQKKHRVILTRWQKVHRQRYVLIQKPPEIQHCIQMYCTMFAIDENDIAFETLKKSYYRYRTKYGRKSLIFG